LVGDPYAEVELATPHQAAFKPQLFHIGQAKAIGGLDSKPWIAMAQPVWRIIAPILTVSVINHGADHRKNP
jgi:hypothetical protein